MFPKNTAFCGRKPNQFGEFCNFYDTESNDIRNEDWELGL